MKYIRGILIVVLGVIAGRMSVYGEPSGSKRQEESIMKYETAVFAGGCFWCMESDFEKREGVNEVISGYMGGFKDNPTYQDYAQKGHIEVIEVTYDPSVITYPQLLDVFWRSIDPTDSQGQFADRGAQYRPAIFYSSREQRESAQASKEALEAAGIFTKPITTELFQATAFYPAEEYHQNYYKKNPARYTFYRFNSGRDRYLTEVWGKERYKALDQKKNTYTKPSAAELKKRLTPLEYTITQKDGTEPAFHNAYWDNKEKGIYVDIVSGEPLFSSEDKFKSGTGWPSFTKPLEPDNIVERTDRSLFMTRTEVRSKHADSHLGHVFNDGPAPTGRRYCMNSAALRFIPQEDLEEEGYGQYTDLF